MIAKFFLMQAVIYCQSHHVKSIFGFVCVCLKDEVTVAQSLHEEGARPQNWYDVTRCYILRIYPINSWGVVNFPHHASVSLLLLYFQFLYIHK